MSTAIVYISVVFVFCFFVTTRSKEFDYRQDVCQTKVNDSSEYCTCMPFHKFKKMCCSTDKKVNFQGLLQKEMQDTNQTMRELQEQIVELQKKENIWGTLLIISGSLNGLVFIIIIKVLVTRRYIKARHSTDLPKSGTNDSISRQEESGDRVALKQIEAGILKYNAVGTETCHQYMKQKGTE
ncbi:uncharacterized protein LOC123560341 [Mercenaria mercenaria]|uniref:uncharacterized protein LOC123560341 n=1 Tax=Mercenaria mercenaria TaxID=6596 RepID=UPI00234E7DE3|nr:uncharacterized protein LOC123560341 [Mercenaria mercenaria]